MAGRKKKSEKKTTSQNFLILRDGRELPVSGEQGRFWLFPGGAVRKASPNLLRIEERTVNEDA